MKPTQSQEQGKTLIRLSRKLNALAASESAVFSDAVEFCENAMKEAEEQGFELVHLHFGGRLAELYIDSGQLDKGYQLYRRLWVRELAPIFFGLQLMKAILVSWPSESRRLEEGKHLLKEMAERLEVERADPERQGHLEWEEVNFLSAQGLMQLECKQERALQRTCTELSTLLPTCSFKQHVDFELVVRLIRAGRLELAHQILGARIRRNVRRKK